MTFETVGTLEEGALCYIIADKADEWIYIESGDVRGFVDSEYLDYGEEVTKQVEAAGEDSFSVAEQVVEPEENGALYYTLTSVKSGIPGRRGEAVPDRICIPVYRESVCMGRHQPD